MSEPLRAVPVRCRPRNIDPPERLGDEIAEISAHIQAATALRRRPEPS